MMTKFLSALPVVLMTGTLYSFSPQATAGPAYNEQLITGNGGYSVTMDHEWAVVGDPTICTIFIYKMDYEFMLWGDGAGNAGAPHSTKAKNCNDSKSRDFGASTSISGDLLAVGAPDANVGNVKSAGKVFVFQLISDSWVEVASDVTAQTIEFDTGNRNLDPQDSAFFGSSVSVSNDLIAVGAPAYDTASVDAGRAYVYKWNDPDPGLNIITWADGEAANDQFGFSVTTNNPQFLVGAPGADSTENPGDLDVGAAYLYTIVAGAISVLNQKITIPDSPPSFTPTTGDNLGFELSLSDSLMLVSGEKAYIIKKITTEGPTGEIITWTPQFEIADSLSGDVSQTNGVGAFGKSGTEVDIYPDLAAADAAAPLANNYHLVVTPPAPGPDLALDIRLFQDFLLINDNTNDQIRAMHFPCRYGDKLEANVWNIVSIACDIPPGTTVEEAFNADPFPGEPNGVLGEYETNWEVWGQDGSDYVSGNSSRMIPVGGEIVQGKSYWIVADGTLKGGDPMYWNVDESVSNTPTAWSAPVGPTGVDISHIGGSYFFELPAAQTDPDGGADFAKVMVGNPWSRVFDWGDVYYKDSAGTLYTLADAAVANFISDVAYVYNPDSTSGQPYDAISLNTPGFSTTMQPNLGFWVEVLAGANTPHQLVMPLSK